VASIKRLASRPDRRTAPQRYAAFSLCTVTGEGIDIWRMGMGVFVGCCITSLTKRGIKAAGRRASLGRPPARRFGSRGRIAWFSFGRGRHKALSYSARSSPRGPALRGFFSRRIAGEAIEIRLLVIGGFPRRRIACPSLTKRGIKAAGRRASLGRTHGPAIWLPWAHSLDFVRTWPL
jgi:hypothetical protein